MPSNTFWPRLREARAVQGLLVFLGASWLILQLLDIFIDNLGVPAWTMVGAIGLLGIGLVIQLSVVWVQALQLARRDASIEAETEAAGVPPAGDELAVDRGPDGRLSFTWARFALGGTFAFAILFGMSGVYVVFAGERQPSGSTFDLPDASAPPGVAVLPFSVSGTRLEEIGDGLVNLLSTNLDGVGGLRAIDSRTVLARWDELVGERDRADQATNLAVAEATGARYALLGSAVAVGPDVRLQADVYEVATGDLLDRRQIEGSPDSVLSLVDRLSVEVMDVVLGRDGTPIPSLDLASITTTSIPALKQYLDGEVAYRRADFELARASYERAIAEDSTFALAHYQLANTWGWTNGPGHEAAVRSRRRAVELGERLPERQALLVQATDEVFRGELSAIEKLSAAVERYPDHAEAWYLLGDAYFHLGPRSLASPVEMDRAFAQAVALDPKFAPFHIHLLDLSFTHRDSARTAFRIDRYRELAPGTLFDRRSRLRFALTYGDSSTRTGAAVQLETLEIEDLHYVGSRYLNACCWHAREPVLREIRDRGDEDARAFAVGQMASGALHHGQLARALELYEDPAINRVGRACNLSAFYLFGFPIRESLLDDVLAIGDIEGASGADALCRAFYAGERGRWTQFDRVLDHYESLEAPSEDDGYHGPASDPTAMTAALRGFRLWKRGQVRAALPLVEEAFSAGMFGWWLGEIYRELGRLEDAARFYAAHYATPLAYLELGRVNEQLGRLAEARNAYEVFVSAWEHADPEMRAWGDEALSGILRISEQLGR